MLNRSTMLAASLVWAAVCVTSVQAETISLIGEDDWYPYSANKDGRLQGFAVDIVKAAYSAVGVDVQLKTMPYARCLEVVKQGVEMGCFDSSDDPAIRGDFLYHKQPLFNAEIDIYALASNNPGRTLTPADLKNKVIGITNGYTYGTEVESDSTIKKDIAPGDLVNVRKLLAGRIQYSLVYTRVMDSMMGSHPAEFSGKVKSVGQVTKHNLYITFSLKRAESKKYADLLDKGLLAIHADGIYSQIEKRWETPPN